MLGSFASCLACFLVKTCFGLLSRAELGFVAAWICGSVCSEWGPWYGRGAREREINQFPPSLLQESSSVAQLPSPRISNLSQGRNNSKSHFLCLRWALVAMKTPEIDKEWSVISMGQISNLSLTSLGPYDTWSVHPAGAAELVHKGVWLQFGLFLQQESLWLEQLSLHTKVLASVLPRCWISQPNSRGNWVRAFSLLLRKVCCIPAPPPMK